MSYSATKEAHTPAQLITASATLGHRGGERFMHCHGAWLDARGKLRAGHLWPETRVGGVPIYAVIHRLPGVDLHNAVDSETRMPAFTPRPSSVSAPGHDAPTRRAVISRVKPGEELLAAASDVCREHGFRHAEIRASLGSIVGARLRQGERVVDIDGPATEVVTVSGTLRVLGDDRLDCELSTILVDRHGVVHAGRLVSGHNLVAVTFELFIAEEHGVSSHG
ncbi:MAG: PCC domain-containing protein [Sciscionella sp.]